MRLAEKCRAARMVAGRDGNGLAIQSQLLTGGQWTRRARSVARSVICERGAGTFRAFRARKSRRRLVERGTGIQVVSRVGEGRQQFVFVFVGVLGGVIGVMALGFRFRFRCTFLFVCRADLNIHVTKRGLGDAPSWDTTIPGPAFILLLSYPTPSFLSSRDDSGFEFNRSDDECGVCWTS